MRLWWGLALFSLSGCVDGLVLKGDSLRSDYLYSECRFYTEDACIDAAAEDCGGGLVFADLADCLDTLEASTAACDDLDASLEAARADVEACIAQLDRFECGGDEPVCDVSGDPVMSTDACAPVQALFDEACG